MIADRIDTLTQHGTAEHGEQGRILLIDPSIIVRASSSVTRALLRTAMVHQDMNNGMFPMDAPVDPMAIYHLVESVTETLGVLVGLGDYLSLGYDFQGRHSSSRGHGVGIECSGVEDLFITVPLCVLFEFEILHDFPFSSHGSSWKSTCHDFCKGGKIRSYAIVFLRSSWSIPETCDDLVKNQNNPERLCQFSQGPEIVTGRREGTREPPGGLQNDAGHIAISFQMLLEFL